TTTRLKNALRDVFILIEDDCELRIDRIDSGDTQEPRDYKKLGNILLEKGEINLEEVNQVIAHKKRIGELLVEEGLLEPEKVESALMEQRHVREIRKKRQETEVASSLRVSSEKVDVLVNLVGELVTLQARLSQLSHARNEPELISISEEVERITWDLRDSSMDMRMLPIGSTFSRFKRLVRDLSNNLGKEVELSTEGGDTELDKTVIEKLNDPLVHIIRNSIDHGIESPGKREKVGKERRGNIHLSAYHSGSNVVISIYDDGGGLDRKQIQQKAVERGIITADMELSDKEVYALIFEPGFSTAQKVSDVSGRGVGMDVVKRNIETLRGFIDIDSETGVGTTFTLNIPLTLAIIDGLLVKIGKEHFVFPLSLVESCIEIPHQQIVDAKGQNYIDVRGQIVPYIYLREKFLIDDEIPDIEQIVIADIKRKRVGFVVDSVIGGHQTVIKSLGKVYKGVAGISGATILGDGTIALIVDSQKLLADAGLDKHKHKLRPQQAEK
ncbi:MAG: chemotaxis protein CheA, partial [bacterium]|nr:chemotaxis protein CheA [bacterium]